MVEAEPIDSVLTSTKKNLGIEEAYTHFDNDLIMHINSVLMILNQLGIGPTDGFGITDKNDVWSDIIGERKDLEAIKTYIYLKVRLVFDPPQTGYLVESINNQCKEFEWRLNIQVELEEQT
jgi:hypothetical protein